jgi:Fic family protein
MISQIGFTYQPVVFAKSKAYRSVSSACFRLKQYFPNYIVGDTSLEGKAHTLPDVKTVLDGTTQGGRKLSDNLDIRNLKNSLDLLISLVSSGHFSLDKTTFCNLHAKAACEEALVWGSFRTSGVSIAGTTFKPPEAARLGQIFDKGINYINALENPMERGVVFFLFGAMNQFFYDGNKRVSRLMMNGALISAGYDALMIPATMRPEFNRQMLHFYNTKSAHKIIEFLLKCHALNATNLA